MRVELLDTPWNRHNNVVGLSGEIKYEGQVLGTLVLTDSNQWIYYMKDQVDFVVV